MTPHDLEKAGRDCERFHLNGRTDTAIYHMLRALLQHEADKEVRKLIQGDQQCP